MSRIEFTPGGNALILEWPPLPDLILEWPPLPDPEPPLLQSENRLMRFSSMGSQVHDSIVYLIPEGLALDEQIMEALKAKLPLLSFPYTSEVSIDSFDDI